MIVQQVIEKRPKFKITLSPEDKAQRKQEIERLVDQVMVRMTEYAGTYTRAEVRKEVTKHYDRFLKEAAIKAWREGNEG